MKNIQRTVISCDGCGIELGNYAPSEIAEMTHNVEWQDEPAVCCEECVQTGMTRCTFHSMNDGMTIAEEIDDRAENKTERLDMAQAYCITHKDAIGRVRTGVKEDGIWTFKFVDGSQLTESLD